MGFGIDRRARSRKGRGLFRRAPDPVEVGDRLTRLARRIAKGAVVRAGSRQGRTLVELALHPAASHARLWIESDGELGLVAETSAVGPAYHADVLAKVAPILDELDYTWTDADPTDVADIGAQMCAWLAGELGGTGQIRIGLPAERRFLVDAPVLTPLGPRDDAWRTAAVADPARAADAFAWWERGPGQAERARALLAMWLEVPWREPLDAAERDLVDRIDADLRVARKAGLDLPWADWDELLANVGKEDEDVHARAAGGAPAIGYRRHDLEVELSGGWTVRLHGGFVGKWEDDASRYWATDGTRAVEFTSLTADDETDSDRLLAVPPEQHPVIARLAEGDLRGRAEAFDDDGDRVVIGLVASAPHVGILTCKGDSTIDDWALATWRSLRRSAAPGGGER